MLMDYLHTYPHGILRYYASNMMILKITSDAAYLVQPKARSRAAAHYHLGWLNSDRTNGPVDILCNTVKNVVSSAAEAETGGIYMGGKHACPMRTALEELAHPQPITRSPFETDNDRIMKSENMMNTADIEATEDSAAAEAYEDYFF